MYEEQPILRIQPISKENASNATSLSHEIHV